MIRSLKFLSFLMSLTFIFSVCYFKSNPATLHRFQCASIFTEIITDVDKTRDLILKDDFKEPSSVSSSNSNPGPRNQSGSPKKDQKRKRNEQFSKEEVNKHLQELNGLTKRTNQIRSDPFNPRNTPNRNVVISCS